MRQRSRSLAQEQRSGWRGRAIGENFLKLH